MGFSLALTFCESLFHHVSLSLIWSFYSKLNLKHGRDIGTNDHLMHKSKVLSVSPLLYDILVTVKEAPCECEIRTGQP